MTSVLVSVYGLMTACLVVVLSLQVFRPVLAASLLLLVTSTIVVFAILVRLRRISENRCNRCDYVVSESPAPACPECGWPRGKKYPLARKAFRSPFLRLSVIVLVLSACSSLYDLIVRDLAIRSLPDGAVFALMRLDERIAWREVDRRFAGSPVNIHGQTADEIMHMVTRTAQRSVDCDNRLRALHWAIYFMFSRDEARQYVIDAANDSCASVRDSALIALTSGMAPASIDRDVYIRIALDTSLDEMIREGALRELKRRGPRDAPLIEALNRISREGHPLLAAEASRMLSDLGQSMQK